MSTPNTLFRMDVFDELMRYHGDLVSFGFAGCKLLQDAIDCLNFASNELLKLKTFDDRPIVFASAKMAVDKVKEASLELRKALSIEDAISSIALMLRVTRVRLLEACKLFLLHLQHQNQAVKTIQLSNYI